MRQLKIWNDSIIFFVLLFFATFCNYLTEAETQWSYTGENGPSNWGEMCAVGQAQVGNFYEFDWLNWLRLWTLSKAEFLVAKSLRFFKTSKWTFMLILFHFSFWSTNAWIIIYFGNFIFLSLLIYLLHRLKPNT